MLWFLMASPGACSAANLIVNSRAIREAVAAGHPAACGTPCTSSRGLDQAAEAYQLPVRYIVSQRLWHRYNTPGQARAAVTRAACSCSTSYTSAPPCQSLGTILSTDELVHPPARGPVLLPGDPASSRATTRVDGAWRPDAPPVAAALAAAHADLIPGESCARRTGRRFGGTWRTGRRVLGLEP